MHWRPVIQRERPAQQSSECVHESIGGPASGTGLAPGGTRIASTALIEDEGAQMHLTQLAVAADGEIAPFENHIAQMTDGIKIGYAVHGDLLCCGKMEIIASLSAEAPLVYR